MSSHDLRHMRLTETQSARWHSTGTATLDDLGRVHQHKLVQSLVTRQTLDSIPEYGCGVALADQ